MPVFKDPFAILIDLVSPD